MIIETGQPRHKGQERVRRMEQAGKAKIQDRIDRTE
jgi:hypothetical protein